MASQKANIGLQNTFLPLTSPAPHLLESCIFPLFRFLQLGGRKLGAGFGLLFRDFGFGGLRLRRYLGLASRPLLLAPNAPTLYGHRGTGAGDRGGAGRGGGGGVEKLGAAALYLHGRASGVGSIGGWMGPGAGAGSAFGGSCRRLLWGCFLNGTLFDRSFFARRLLLLRGCGCGCFLGHAGRFSAWARGRLCLCWSWRGGWSLGLDPQEREREQVS
jgi:hypothetical protein